MVEIEFTDPNQRVQKLIEYFDLNLERNMDFDINICFHGPDQNCEEEKNLKDLLDELIQNERGWDRISASCRRMIICDRELDLEKGIQILAESLPLFKRLLNLPDDQLSESQTIAQNIVNEYKNQIYEIIRYINTCGLISYRSGDYSKALNFFKLAECVSRNPSSFLSYFIPDTTSNRIRTEFELFSQVLPSKIIEDNISKDGKRLLDFIVLYKNEIDRRDYNFEQDGEIGYWIYGHGMASLYHNLAEAYSFVVNKNIESPSLKALFKEYAKSAGDVSLENRLDTDNLKSIFKDYAISANRISLIDYGLAEKYRDIYRQLQSKNALRRLGCNVVDYENDILDGKWERGKSMVYQDKIRAEGDKLKDKKIILRVEEFESKAEEFKLKVEGIIDEGIRKGYFKIRMSDDKIGMSDDKIGILHNLSSIQYFMKVKPFDSIWVEGNELTFFDISLSKIRVAEELRNIFSPILYKRQVLKLIREDILFVTNEYIKREEHDEALNFSEYFSNRGLTELTRAKVYKNSSSLENIESIKAKIQKFMESQDIPRDDCYVQNCGTSLVLEKDTNEDFLKLVLGYEDILKYVTVEENNKEISKFSSRFNEKNVIALLKNKLNQIPDRESTIIMKFLSPDFNEETLSLKVFLITKSGVIKRIIASFDSKSDYDLFISDVKNALEETYKGKNNSFNKRLPHKKMAILANKLNKSKLYESIKDYKNIFIVPDGELFQIPLHLLGPDGQDLRIDHCVYYSPSLENLVGNKYINRVSPIEEKYLWLCSPTKNLFTTKHKPCLWKPNVMPDKKIKRLECTNGTLKEFKVIFKPNEYTHVGFSTHAVFHDNIVTAYASLIRFYDSFLTTYDILLSMDFSGVKTVFLGACSGASSKYTDENEAVGLVTAFLLKGSGSVIAPLCEISGFVHNNFITVINNSGVINTCENWNLDKLSIFKDLGEIAHNKLVPFVQYTSLETVEKKI